MITETLYEHFKNCSGICTDTRKIKKNNLFFALRGDNFNGNTFAAQALANGAKYCVIDDPQYAVDKRCIVVDDTLQALQQLATFHRNQLKLPIIALTGSNGKTTTKELINAVLSQKYNTTATKGNLNNHIGVPLTLLQMDDHTEIGLVEMGANHPKEIALLCDIAQPDYGLITNFGKAHLEGFGSLEGVIKAKSELYDFLKAHHKTIFVNENDPVQVQQTINYDRVYKFGNQNSANTKLTILDTQPYITVGYNNTKIKSRLTGAYNFNNIASAIAVGSFFDVDSKQIVSAIENYTPTNNRSQIIKRGSNTIIMDAYNANPTSMLAALENFNQLDQHPKVLVLGDMFELGASAAKEHQNIVDYLETHNIGKAYLVGTNFFNTTVKDPLIKKLKSFDHLKTQLQEHPVTGTLLLIKGSRSMALERVLECIDG